MDGSRRGAYESIGYGRIDQTQQLQDRYLRELDQKIGVPEAAPILGMSEQDPNRVKTRADVVKWKGDGLTILTDQSGEGDKRFSRELMIRLQIGLGKALDDRISHLRERAMEDPAFAPKFESAVKMEIETAVKEIVTAEFVGQPKELKWSFQSAKIFSALDGTKKAFVIGTGRGRAFVLDARGNLSPVLDSLLEQDVKNNLLTRSDAQFILDAQAGGAVPADLRFKRFEYDKRKKEEREMDAFQAVPVTVTDDDKLLLVSEGVSERLTSDVLERLIIGDDSAMQLEDELQLNAHIRVRSASMRFSKDVAISVLDVGVKHPLIYQEAEISSNTEELVKQLKDVQSAYVYGESRHVDYATELKKASLRQEIERLKYDNAKERSESALSDSEKNNALLQMERAFAAFTAHTNDVNTAKEMLRRKAESDRTMKETLARKKATSYANPQKETFSTAEL